MMCNFVDSNYHSALNVLLKSTNIVSVLKQTYLPPPICDALVGARFRTTSHCSRALNMKNLRGVR